MSIPCGKITTGGPCVLAVLHRNPCQSVDIIARGWHVRFLLQARMYIHCGKPAPEGLCAWPELHPGDCAGQSEVERVLSTVAFQAPVSILPSAGAVHVLLFPAPEEGVDAGFTVGPFKDRAEAEGYIERFRQATNRPDAYGGVMESFYDPEALIAQLNTPDEDDDAEPEKEEEEEEDNTPEPSLTADEINDFNGYLRGCTNAQILGVLEKECGRGMAGRPYMVLARAEGQRRGVLP